MSMDTLETKRDEGPSVRDQKDGGYSGLWILIISLVAQGFRDSASFLYILQSDCCVGEVLFSLDIIYPRAGRREVIGCCFYSETCK